MYIDEASRVGEIRSSLYLLYYIGNDIVCSYMKV